MGGRARPPTSGGGPLFQNPVPDSSYPLAFKQLLSLTPGPSWVAPGAGEDTHLASEGLLPRVLQRVHLERHAAFEGLPAGLAGEGHVLGVSYRACTMTVTALGGGAPPALGPASPSLSQDLGCLLGRLPSPGTRSVCSEVWSDRHGGPSGSLASGQEKWPRPPYPPTFLGETDPNGTSLSANPGPATASLHGLCGPQCLLL